MDVETKLETIKGFAEEIVVEDELKQLFETNDHPLAYNGFEPSGIAPIHFGLMITKNINSLLKAGCKVNLYMADYFAFINNKMDGDLDKIRTVGTYFVEMWKAAGVDTDKAKVVWCKDLMEKFDYWEMFMKAGKVPTLDRSKRAITVMGRKEGDTISTAQIFYPIMQVTDIFQMDIDICQLGMDQRKANILAREVAHKYKWKVPIAVHNPLLLGLQGMPDGAKRASVEEQMEYKMSKSNPRSAIYVHESAEAIKSKINSAYCPEKVIEGNPVIGIMRHILINSPKDSITIDRPKKFGGPIEAGSYEEFAKMYSEGKIHPMDLKAFVADGLEEQIRPIREHFEKNKKAKELYELVKSYDVTR